MGKSSPKASPATVTPLQAFLAAAVEHFDAGQYAQSITVATPITGGVQSRAAFSAGVFKRDGLMCLIVSDAGVLTDYSVKGSKKPIALPATSLFGTDPLIERKAIAAKASDKASTKVDEALANAHIAQWAASNVADPRAIKVLGDLGKVATRCGKKGARLDGAILAFGATGAETTTKTWERVDEILADIAKA
mgnify:FL=1